jgi:hypothetical protein
MAHDCMCMNRCVVFHFSQRRKFIYYEIHCLVLFYSVMLYYFLFHLICFSIILFSVIAFLPTSLSQ